MDECKPLHVGAKTHARVLNNKWSRTVARGRGLNSSSSQLNLSHFLHKNTPYTPPTYPDTQ